MRLSLCLLITGERDWPSREHVEREILMAVGGRDVTDATIQIHLVLGDCKTGVDRFAREWAERVGCSHRVHAADWEKFGKPRAAWYRNQEMAEECAASPLELKRALAFWSGRGAADQRSDVSGTLDCMGRCAALHIVGKTIPRPR